jgi:hypothetical protein
MQLIANDALEYFLLINDNTVADYKQHWRIYKGDYLYKNRNKEYCAVSICFAKSIKDKK